MRFLLFISAVLALVTLPAHANDEQPLSVETTSARTSLLVCVASQATGTQVSDIADKFKLPELPPENAALFAPAPSRVYAVPPHLGNIVLMARHDGPCQIAIRKLDPAAFWTNIDATYALPSNSPFKAVTPASPSSHGATRTYEGTIKNTKIHVVISASDTFQENGMQGIITVSSVK